MHLGNSDLRSDLGLRELVEESEFDDTPLALVERVSPAEMRDPSSISSKPVSTTPSFSASVSSPPSSNVALATESNMRVRSRARR